MARDLNFMNGPGHYWLYHEDTDEPYKTVRYLDVTEDLPTPKAALKRHKNRDPYDESDPNDPSVFFVYVKLRKKIAVVIRSHYIREYFFLNELEKKLAMDYNRTRSEILSGSPSERDRLGVLAQEFGVSKRQLVVLIKKYVPHK